MRQPTVSFLVPDISAPSLGAATRLAQNIRDRFEVEIVGPDLGGGVCSMYRGAFPYKAVPCPRLYRLPDFWRESRALGRAVGGDIVIAVKAFADTVPVALRERRRRGGRVLVYLDEWDGAIVSGWGAGRRAVAWCRHAHHPLESIHYPVVERRIPRADGVLSTTTFLQRRFGGRIVHLGVDTGFFKPQPELEVAALKAELGLRDRMLIVFGGVVRPHKGVESILDAMLRTGDARIRLLVVGPLTAHLKELMADPRYAGRVRCAGAPSEDDSGLNARIHGRMQLYLDLADLVVLPQTDAPLAQSQMPCKVFEAMAMAKPVIASRVADLPRVLDGCGWVVEPGDTDALARQIAYVLANPRETRAAGRAAREKCLREYSREKTARDLSGALSDVWRDGHL